MTAIWNNLLHVLNTMPAWLAAMLIGWAVSIGITQSAKFTMPLQLPVGWREAASRWLAFVTAALPAGAWMVQAEATALVVVLVGLLSGVWAPVAFAILQWALRLSPKTAGLADLLSGDKRGVIKTMLAGKP